MKLRSGIKDGHLIHLEHEDILNGFQENYAYEIIRLINARPLFLDLHYERLEKSCITLQIDPPKKERIEKDIKVLVKHNQIANNNLKIAIDQSNYAIYPIPSKYPGIDDYSKGVHCALLYEERDNPEIKAFQSDLRAKSNKQISQEKVYESVLVNDEGKITEGSRSNLFFIKDATIITAPDHLVLGGITRLKVLEICNALHLDIYFKAIAVEELRNMDAAFICGTSPGVLPISFIENESFNAQYSTLCKIHNSYHSKYLSKPEL